MTLICYKEAQSNRMCYKEMHNLTECATAYQSHVHLRIISFTSFGKLNILLKEYTKNVFNPTMRNKYLQ